MLPPLAADRTAARRLRNVAGGARSVCERVARGATASASTWRRSARLVHAAPAALAAGWAGKIHHKGKDGAAARRGVDDLAAPRTVAVARGFVGWLVATRNASEIGR